MYRRTLSLLVVAALASALLPAVALAAPATGGEAAIAPAAPAKVPATPKKDGAGAGGMSALAADSAPADAREEDGTYRPIGNTVVWDNLPNLTDYMYRWDAFTPGWGHAPWMDARTIDTANATQWDEDWYRLEVLDADFDEYTNLSYRLDAFSMNRDVDLVIDVYATGVMPAVADEVFGEDPIALVSNDDSPWVYDSTYDAWGRSSSVAFMPPAPGDYWVRVRPYYAGAVDGFSGCAGSYTFRAKYGQVERLSGADRIATAVRISQEGWPTQPVESVDTAVVIAYSQNYPDALSASSLAGACGSPVLLNGAEHLSSAVAAEIARLGFQRAYIIGGEAAIKPAVEDELQAILGLANVERISGADRYETAAEVLEETDAVLTANGDTMPSVAFLASGTNFPDALALGPISYWQKAPILLTNPTELSDDTASALAMYGIADVIIAGGNSAVSAGVQGEVSDLGIPSNRILRVSGADRYETAKEIAAWACDLKGPGIRDDGGIGTTNNTTALDPLESPYLNAFASGATYPDALAGGAFAGKARAPILLTRKEYAPPILFGADGEIDPGSTQWFSDLYNNSWLPIEQSYLLGGTAAVSDDAFWELDYNTGEFGAP